MANPANEWFGVYRIRVKYKVLNAMQVLVGIRENLKEGKRRLNARRMIESEEGEHVGV